MSEKNSKRKRLEMQGVLSSFISQGQNTEANASNPENLSQLSVRVPHALLEQMRDLAFYERSPLQQLVQEAFELYLQQYPPPTLQEAKELRAKKK